MGVSLPGGGGGGRGRNLNAELNLVPFIDLLSALITFLLATAVWSQTEAMKVDSGLTGSPFKTLARKYGVSEAQVLLRWGIQKGYPVLPKSTNLERLQQNADVFSFSIDDGDMAALEELDRGDGVAWPSGDPIKAA